MTKEERYKAINVLYELKNNLVSENLISRVDVVMKILCHEEDPCPYWDYESNTCRHTNIGALATVTPIRPKGEWIEDDLHNIVCSNCKGIRRDNRYDHIYFCNKCGADMRKPCKAESEDKE